MANISVRRLAEKFKKDIPDLLTMLEKAGINKGAEDELTEAESKSFIAFVMKRDSASTEAKPKKLSMKGGRLGLKKKVIKDTQGSGREVTVIKRKSRVVQKDTNILNELAEQEAREKALKEQQRLEQEAREAELAKQAELERQREEEALRAAKQAKETQDTKDIKEAKAKKDVDSKSEVSTEKQDKTDKKVKKKTDSTKDESESEDSVKAKVAAKTKKQVQQEQEKKWNSQKAIYEFVEEQDDLADDVGAADEVAVKAKKVAKPVLKEVKKIDVSKFVKTEHGFKKPTKPMIHEVAIPQEITVGELAQRMAIKTGKLIKTLMHMGTMATINQVLDQDTAVLVVEELGHKAKLVKENAIEESLKAKYEGDVAKAELSTRAPVVTIMGHVDHGKTSLLDYIRRTKVTDKEAGGITQHIGAYSVTTNSGKITFLDTPGHAAFSAMRARGATITDVVVLVVSADDGVMPQTIEAIQHSKAAGVPIVVAINKIDKPEADPDRIKNELSQHEVIPEDWGGEHQFVEVSAKTGQGIDNLLDSILLQTEILELKAAKDVPAKGVVIESRLDKGRGVVATILVQQGTLHKGDILLAGCEYGRVRAMIDAAGHKLDAAYPSDPVEILGLSSPPNAGDEVMVTETEREAREVALFRESAIKLGKHAKEQASSVEDLFSRAKDSNVSILNVIIKADVQGSSEAISSSLEKLSTDEVKVKIISQGVGGINESDVTLAMASKAIVIGFNVRADQGARRLAESEDVKIIYDSIIYNVIDDIKSILSGMLTPEIREEIVGLAQVKDVFRSSKIGAIAGCMVIEGIVKKNNPIRVLRDNVVIYEGELESLRRFKDDVNEVKHGTECGIGVKNYNDVKVGDQIEVFQKVTIQRTLD